MAHKSHRMFRGSIIKGRELASSRVGDTFWVSRMNSSTLAPFFRGEAEVFKVDRKAVWLKSTDEDDAVVIRLPREPFGQEPDRRYQWTESSHVTRIYRCNTLPDLMHDMTL